jgi:DNA-binding transcriptional LysR family regulator
MAWLGEDITFGQLRTFQCAAHAGSFVKAAYQLGISQPAVSEQITVLEQRLGYRLFRRRRGTTPLLTDEGAETLVRVTAILDASERLFEFAGGQSARMKVLIRLCIGPGLRDAYLKPLLPLIYRDHPQLELDLIPMIPVPDMTLALEKGRADLIVYTVTTPIQDWPHVRHVCDVPVVLVAPPDRAAPAGQAERRLEDCQFILPKVRDLAQNWSQKYLDELGVRPQRPPLYVEFVDVILEMVEAGQGLSILMYESVADHVAQGRLKVLAPKFTPMHRIIARSPVAPREVDLVEGHLLKAFLLSQRRFEQMQAAG